MNNPVVTLALITAAVALISLRYSPNAQTTKSFYKGHDASGRAPGIFTLTFSQVTTWIFARSIMNAAILGYFYGIAGALSYAAYYLSFLTGAAIISSLRFRHGFGSVQEFLADRFGLAGTTSYNFVVGVRLLSEVFANLLVIGLIFGMDGSQEYVASIMLVGAATLGYSLLGGLNASIRTDAIQMSLFLIVLGALMAVAIASGSFDVPAMMATSTDAASPGWVLLARRAAADLELSAARSGHDGPRLHRRPQDHDGELLSRRLDFGSLHHGLRAARRLGRSPQA